MATIRINEEKTCSNCSHTTTKTVHSTNVTMDSMEYPAVSRTTGSEGSFDEVLRKVIHLRFCGISKDN